VPRGISVMARVSGAILLMSCASAPTMASDIQDGAQPATDVSNATNPNPAKDLKDSSSVKPVSRGSTDVPRPMGPGKITGAAKPRVVKAASVPMISIQEDQERLAASATIGAPTSESARAAAVEAFADGSTYLGNHQWTKAAESFQLAISYDGSVAKYHAALGRVMMIQHRWLQAQAAYTAAVLLDLDNKDYQKQLKKARSSR
jgi:hypothetical protein